MCFNCLAPDSRTPQSICNALSHSGRRMRELTMDGAAANPEEHLKDLGFLVGGFVRRKADKVEAQITAVQKDMVKMKMVEGGEACSASMQSFLDLDWAAFVPRESAQLVEDLAAHAPSLHPDWHAMRVAHSIQTEILAMTDKHEMESCKHLSVQVKPGKAVIAQEKIGKGKLLLVPSTLKISVKPADAVVPSGFRVKTPYLDKSFWLLPTVIVPKETESPGFLNPFWLVQTTSIADEANMTLAYLKGTNANKLELPVLKNTKHINPQDKLLLFKEKNTKQPEALIMSPETKQGKKRKAPK